MDKNDEILLQAAKAAAAKLPKLEADKKELADDLIQLTTKINQYRTIMASAGLSADQVEKTEAEKTPSGKSAKGSCMAAIDTVIENKSLSVKEIQEAISIQTALPFGFSTVYANLQRGKEQGRYKNDNGKWSKS